MKVFDRLRTLVSTSRPAQRNYSAGQTGRLVLDWATSPASIDQEIRRNLKSMRFRSRDLERNNPFVRGFLGSVQSQVIGDKGIGLQMQVKDADGTPDKFANDQIQAAWKEWSRKGICTMDGRLSWQDAQRLFVRTVARDGEILIRLVRGKAAGNRFGFAIQLVEVDHLDEDDIRQLPGARRVKMGVEVNEWNRPLGYHVWRAHPGDNEIGFHQTDKQRVAASDMLHPYIHDRPGQTRGIPWIVSAMLRLQMLGGYEEAELIASRIAASKMGFFESVDGAEYDGDGEDEVGNTVTEVEPGVMERLPAGVKFQPWDPQHPTTAFDPFLKAMLLGIGTSVNMSYPAFSGDLAGVNFSSLRQGALTDRDSWRVLQNWTLCNLHAFVFESFLQMALTMGAIPLPLAKFDKFNAPTWQPRGWQWVDPGKESTADINSHNAGHKSLTAILAARGQSVEDFADELLREQQVFKDKGLKLPEPKGFVPIGEDNGEDENDQGKDK